MKIVQLNPYHYPYNGGIEHRIHHISRRLAKDHEVFVLTSRLPGTEERETIDGYTVVRLPSRYLNIYNPPVVWSHGVLDALRKIGPDVVDYHYRWARSYNTAMKRYDGGKVFTFHNTFGEGTGAGRALSVLNDSLFLRSIERYDKIICVSEFVERDLIKRGVPSELMSVVPAGVEPISMPTSDDGFILFVGRLVRTKGLSYLIDSMKMVDSKLIICGSGPEEARLRHQIAVNGLDNKVELRGRVDEQEKMRLMASCSVFVMPSTWESYGLAVVEAMALEKPIVASNCRRATRGSR